MFKFSQSSKCFRFKTRMKNSMSASANKNILIIEHEDVVISQYFKHRVEFNPTNFQVKSFQEVSMRLVKKFCFNDKVHSRNVCFQHNFKLRKMALLAQWKRLFCPQTYARFESRQIATKKSNHSKKMSLIS